MIERFLRWFFEELYFEVDTPWFEGGMAYNRAFLAVVGCVGTMLLSALVLVLH